MADHRKQALARIEHWQEILTRELEDTSSSTEKRRLERELAELQQAALDLEELSDRDAARLSDRLAASPLDWVNHRHQSRGLEPS